jgi:serine/threonine protein kinase
MPECDPASLPTGARVGPWRVVGWRGRGSYGAVYRAVREGREEAGPVALKLALQPGDPRFEREARLLSRVRHPGVPRLLGQGDWRHPSGAAHPYLAMEWVQGIPLYDWASVRNPSSRQVLRVLAQAALALEAVHGAKAAHRDVKGGNVLVRPGDGRVFLTDFGSGHYAGAAPLTRQQLPPGTPAYRSPEAWRFVQRFRDEPSARYAATPADDLFALGVTAYRLVTDEYPPSTAPEEDKAGVWRMDGEGPRTPFALNYRVESRLNALIMKMLSVRPEERGTAAGLAAELEQAAEHAGPEAEHPLFAMEEQASASKHSGDVSFTVLLKHGLRQRDPQVLQLSARYDEAEKAGLERLAAEDLARSKARTEREPSVAPARFWRYLGIVAAAACLGTLYPAGVRTVALEEAPAAGSPDGGTAGLGDEAELSTGEMNGPASRASNIRLDVLPKPFEGQLRPPCEKGHVAIQGGCWVELKSRAPNCPERAYAWNGGCYMPIFAAPSPATSDPH